MRTVIRASGCGAVLRASGGWRQRRLSGAWVPDEPRDPGPGQFKWPRPQARPVLACAAEVHITGLTARVRRLRTGIQALLCHVYAATPANGDTRQRLREALPARKQLAHSSSVLVVRRLFLRHLESLSWTLFVRSARLGRTSSAVAAHVVNASEAQSTKRASRPDQSRQGREHPK